MYSVLKRSIGVPAIVLALLVIAGTSPARTATVAITGGTTTIFLTSEPLLNALPVGGVSLNPLGTATTNAGAVTELLLPITGGTLDTTTGALLLQHVGSGIQFADASSNEVNLNDLVIDTASATVSATVTGDFGGPVGPSNETVFSIFLASILVTTPDLDLILNGLDPVVPNGFAFGVLADPETAVVPLPAALPLLLTALAAMGLLGWRRKRAAAGPA